MISPLSSKKDTVDRYHCVGGGSMYIYRGRLVNEPTLFVLAMDHEREIERLHAALNDARVSLRAVAAHSVQPEMRIDARQKVAAMDALLSGDSSAPETSYDWRKLLQRCVDGWRQGNDVAGPMLDAARALGSPLETSERCATSGCGKSALPGAALCFACNEAINDLEQSEKASPKPAMVICNKPTPDGPCLNDAGHDGDCDGIPY